MKKPFLFVVWIVKFHPVSTCLYSSFTIEYSRYSGYQHQLIMRNNCLHHLGDLQYKFELLQVTSLACDLTVKNQVNMTAQASILVLEEADGKLTWWLSTLSSSSLPLLQSSSYSLDHHMVGKSYERNFKRDKWGLHSSLTIISFLCQGFLFKQLHGLSSSLLVIH